MTPIKQIIVEAWKGVNGIKKPIFELFLLLCIFPLLYLQAIHLVRLVIHPGVWIVFGWVLYDFVEFYVLLLMVITGVRQMAFRAEPKSGSIWSLRVFYLISICVLFIVLSDYMYLPRYNIGEKGVAISLFYVLSIPLLIFSMPLAVFYKLDVKASFVQGYKLFYNYWIETVCYFLLPILILLLLFNVYYNFLPGSLSISPVGSLFLVLLPFVLCIWIIPFFANLVGILFRSTTRNREK